MHARPPASNLFGDPPCRSHAGSQHATLVSRLLRRWIFGAVLCPTMTPPLPTAPEEDGAHHHAACTGQGPGRSWSSYRTTACCRSLSFFPASASAHSSTCLPSDAPHTCSDHIQGSPDSTCTHTMLHHGVAAPQCCSSLAAGGLMQCLPST